AMFDEIDEGTAIFKCANSSKVPLNSPLSFMGIEDDLPSDYYLWLTGQAARWFHGDNRFGVNKPVR
ncbi:MAG: xylosidase, partial [Bacteroidota bacterium]|nr:xylosidase [Bacteroidota bacterium]